MMVPQTSPMVQSIVPRRSRPRWIPATTKTDASRVGTEEFSFAAIIAIEFGIPPVISQWCSMFIQSSTVWYASRRNGRQQLS